MQQTYRHEALTYDGPDEFVASCLASAADGRASDTRVIFLFAAAKLAALRASLDRAADEVAMVATDVLGRNPARIVTMLDSFRASGDGRPCLAVTESIDSGRSRAAVAEAQFADSVLNSAALTEWPLSVVCMYDASALDEASTAAMWRSHPAIRGQSVNDSYEPELAATTFGIPLDAPPDDVQWRRIRGDELAVTREYVRDRARDHDLSGERLDDLVFAANELVTNSVRHGGRECRVAVWPDDECVVCEVRDAGIMTDPLVGRLAPPLDSSGGRGLWLVNQLCDLVQIRSAAQGTAVRLHIDRVS
jgi:anti-sigma regulatory factor (Ser/Thr protein kinase)